MMRVRVIENMLQEIMSSTWKSQFLLQIWIADKLSSVKHFLVKMGALERAIKFIWFVIKVFLTVIDLDRKGAFKHKH